MSKPQNKRLRKKRLQKDTDKLYRVVKLVKASSALAAIRKERFHKVDNVVIDENWSQDIVPRLADAMGFTALEKRTPTKNEYD